MRKDESIDLCNILELSLYVRSLSDPLRLHLCSDRAAWQ